MTILRLLNIRRELTLYKIGIKFVFLKLLLYFMKNRRLEILVFIAFVIVITLFMAFRKSNVEEAPTGAIQWNDINTAMSMQKTAPKFVLVDLYTSWCGWCKKMDDNTFSDAAISKRVNEKFYAVKFDAEQQATLMFKGAEYKYSESGGRGLHQLAKDWGTVNGRIGYPTVVILDSDGNKLGTYPGYKDVEQMNKLLQYYTSNAYKTKSWTEYSNAN
jgi:thioredoxin-related protein